MNGPYLLDKVELTPVKGTKFLGIIIDKQTKF